MKYSSDAFETSNNNNQLFTRNLIKAREFNSIKSNYFGIQSPAQPEQKKLLKYR